MGHGNGHHHIKPTGVNSLPNVGRAGENGNGRGVGNAPPKSDDAVPKHPKANADVLFDKNWHKSQADARRNNLTSMIAGGETRSHAGRDASASWQPEPAKNLLNMSLDKLISTAAEHKDLKSFSKESREFWTEVKKMSELRTIETFVNGKPAQRVVSRYGDLLALLEKLEKRGESFEKFINSLPRSEKNVFLARYQIHRTFGASELFAGRGVALDKNGHFPLDVFLSANDKNAHVSVSSLLSLIGGDLSSEAAAMLEQNGIALNGAFLLDGKSAALTAFGLALYQNINALLSLNELAPEAFQPKTAPETSSPKAAHEQPTPARFNSKNTFDNAEFANAANRRAGEMLASGALINGALATIEKYRKAKIANADLIAGIESDDFGFRFSAGATGAMMGATVGCVVPLAEKSLGEVLGFAASVVVGLTDTGLRSLGANALVSVITSGVQSFLNVSSAVGEKTLPDGAPSVFLNAADAVSEFFEAGSSPNVMNRRVDAFSPS